MDIYLVEPPIQILNFLSSNFECKPNVLLSYARWQDFDFSLYTHAYRKKFGKLMLDSGAYTHMQGRINIEIHDYTSFLRSCSNLFDYVINLDIDTENEDVRMWNLRKLEKNGVSNILPVVHAPYSGEIEELYERGYTYQLLGSTFGSADRQLDYIFNRYFHSGRFPGIMFHKLGTSTYKGLSKYPYRSCDSTYLMRIGGMGNVLYWNPYRESDKNGDQTDVIYFGGFIRNKLPEAIDYSHYSYLDQFRSYLWQNFGFDLTDIHGQDKALNRWIVNAKYMVDLETRITQLHGI